MANNFIIMICLMAISFFPYLLIVKKAIAPRLQSFIELKYKDYRHIFKKHNLSKRLVLIFVLIYSIGISKF